MNQKREHKSKICLKTGVLLFCILVLCACGKESGAEKAGTSGQDTANAPADVVEQSDIEEESGDAAEETNTEETSADETGKIITEEEIRKEYFPGSDPFLDYLGGENLQEKLKPEYIPEGLLAELEKIYWELEKNDFQESAAWDRLEEMYSETEIPEEDWDSYANGEDAEDTIDFLKEVGGYLFLVDADNDGVKDLYAIILSGGTDWIHEMVLLKGQEDGSFLCTESECRRYSNQHFILYEGKNYLVDELYDYKIPEGFEVCCYEDGIHCEKVEMRVESDDFDTEITSSDKRLKEEAELLAEYGKDQLPVHGIGCLFFTGNAESKEEDEAVISALLEEYNSTNSSLSLSGRIYHSDFNNDGEEEWYFKEMFWPSSPTNVYLRDELYLPEHPGKYVKLQEYYELGQIGAWFFVEPVELEQGKKNILFQCDYKGIGEYYVYGYLIEGKKAEKIFELAWIGKQEMDYRVYGFKEGDAW